MWVFIAFIFGFFIGALVAVFTMAVIESAELNNLEDEENYND